MKRRAPELVCDTLARLGVTTVFGMAGTQNLPLFEALRTSRLRTVPSTSELAASFAANGYYRASGEVGVLMTIPGPGFMLALNGIAEARADSAAVLLITSSAEGESTRKFQHQQLDLNGIAGHLFKGVFDVERGDQLASAIVQAYRCALSGEPGPVMVHLRRAVYGQFAEPIAVEAPQPPPGAESQLPPEALPWIAAARRPLIFVGHGCASAAADLRRLAERMNAPVMSTCSGRGILPDSHPLALPFDYGLGGVDAAHACVDGCDLVLAIGCKLSHNGSGGFGLRLAPGALVHVDASEEVVGANYPARYGVVGDAGGFVRGLLEKLEAYPGASQWTLPEVKSWRDRIESDADRAARELPSIRAGRPISCAEFFEMLRSTLPPSACLVTDSGYHQMIARRLFRVEAARGLIVPADWQSMGFAIPAAIGAALAAPERRVAALVGDGGMAITGMELLTAVREKIDLLVIIFNDGYLGLIRKGQIEGYGREHAVGLRNPDFSAFAAAIGANYFTLDEEPTTVLKKCATSPGVTILEARVEDPAHLWRTRLRGAARSELKKALPPGLAARIRKTLGA